MARTKKTQEQRKADTDALRNRQEAAVLDLIDSQRWTDYLNAMRHFRSYSINNTLLILTQLPTATRVGGFHTWRKLGRRITSGPGSSIKIWGKPYRPKKWVEKGTEGNAHIYAEDADKVKIDANYTRCPILSVFDVSQTDGDPLPEIVETLTDDDNTTTQHHALESIITWLTNSGWTIAHETLTDAKGYTSHAHQHIGLNSTNTTAQDLKTLIHEAAHAVLHGDDTYAPISEYHQGTHRGVAEVQAESVAYVVANTLGLDTSNYSTGYVAGWATNAAQSDNPTDVARVLHQAAAAVHDGANAILDGVEALTEDPVAA